MKHNNDFRHDLEVGQKGEKLLEDMIEGDKIEVKSEQTKMSKNWMTTGNCFVEYESRDKISGLAHTESKWWAINFMDGDELCFSAFLPVDRMKKIGRKFYKEKGYVQGGDNNTSKGVLVPISALFDPKSHLDKEKEKPLTEEEKVFAWGQSVIDECEKNEREYSYLMKKVKKNG
tara:strand:- start:2087 stop:2608 length:522 start_codon:yes stop_codon:yes gene_type:complete